MKNIVFYENGNLDALLYIGIPLLVLVLLAVGFFIYSKVSKKRKNKEGLQIAEKIILHLGNKENISSLESKGSRLVVVLKDKTLMNEEELKNVGVSSLVKMSSKVTLVLGNLSSEVEKVFNSK